MIAPYMNAFSGEKHDFNFYHSQGRINIECAFGMLVSRWQLVMTPMIGISVGKSISVTLALCRLHNFMIDERDETARVILGRDH